MAQQPLPMVESGQPCSCVACAATNGTSSAVNRRRVKSAAQRVRRGLQALEVAGAHNAGGSDHHHHHHHHNHGHHKDSDKKLARLADWLVAKDPGALYSVLEDVGRHQVQESHRRLLAQLKDTGLGKREHCRAFALALCREFDQLCRTARRQLEVVRSLETAHLAEMGLSWELMCQHWFHSLVFESEQIRAVQAALTERLKPLPMEEEVVDGSPASAEPLKRLQELRASMAEVASRWRKAQQLLESWQLQMQQHNAATTGTAGGGGGLDDEASSLMRQLYKMHVEQGSTTNGISPTQALSLTSGISNANSATTSSTCTCDRCGRTLCGCSLCAFSHCVTCVACCPDEEHDGHQHQHHQHARGRCRSLSPEAAPQPSAGSLANAANSPTCSSSGRSSPRSGDSPCSSCCSSLNGDEDCQPGQLQAGTGGGVAGGRHCDCCYCELFGQSGDAGVGGVGVGQQPAVPPGFFEKRDQLRLKLKKKKEMQQMQQQQQTAAQSQRQLSQPSVSDIDALVKFIEGGKANSGASGRAKNKLQQQQQQKIKKASSAVPQTPAAAADERHHDDHDNHQNPTQKEDQQVEQIVQAELKHQSVDQKPEPAQLKEQKMQQTHQPQRHQQHQQQKPCSLENGIPKTLHPAVVNGNGNGSNGSGNAPANKQQQQQNLKQIRQPRTAPTRTAAQQQQQQQQQPHQQPHQQQPLQQPQLGCGRSRTFALNPSGSNLTPLASASADVNSAPPAMPAGAKTRRQLPASAHLLTQPMQQHVRYQQQQQRHHQQQQQQRGRQVRGAGSGFAGHVRRDAKGEDIEEVFKPRQGSFDEEEDDPVVEQFKSFVMNLETPKERQKVCLDVNSLSLSKKQ